MTSKQTSIWRTLIRIEEIKGNKAHCVVLGWNPRKRNTDPARSHRQPRPSSTTSKNKPKLPVRLFAYVNLAAEEPKDLKPHSFEMAPEPDESLLT